jgi:hypothetical protein
MYALPNDQIDLGVVRAFCLEEHEEGLDLDFKQDWTGELPRVLCAMANVQGGMVLVGVKTKPGTRKPDWPPPGVPGTEDELNQRVIQIAYDSVYPPLLPQVKICPLEKDPTRAVVVIRVDASRLMHATDQRRRIYIRVADQKRGYDLADLSQLEWLWQQREASVQLRKSLLSGAERRADELLRPPGIGRTESFTPNAPKLVLYATPMYPSSASKRTPPELVAAAKAVGAKQSNFTYYMSSIPATQVWRTAPNRTYALEDSNKSGPEQYMEIGAHGTTFLAQLVYKWADNSPFQLEEKNISAQAVVAYCKAFFEYIQAIYLQLGISEPIELSAKLTGIREVVLHHLPANVPNRLNISNNAFSAQDDDVVLLSEELLSRDLPGASRRLLEALTCQLMWAFGFPDTRETLIDKYLPRIIGP